MALFRGIRGACIQLLAVAARPPLGLIPGVHPKSRAARLKRFVRSATCNTAATRYASYLRLFDDPAIKELLGPSARSRGANENLEASDWVANTFGTQFPDLGCQRIDDVQAALACDRQVYLPDDLLTKVDRCSMLHALEVRSPFMDQDLVEFASTLTTSQLLKGGPKRMLREAFADALPAWVFKRKKMGFAVPIGEWFRDSLRPMLHDHLFAADSFASSHFNTPTVRRLVEEHESQRADHSQRLYALLMLELWWKTQQR
jgi:asparagine synthase (glutamine-hydrolysing)